MEKEMTITYQELVHAMATWHLVEVLEETENEVKELELITNKLVAEEIEFKVLGVSYLRKGLGILTQEEFDAKVKVMEDNLNDYIEKYQVQTLDENNKKPDLIHDLMFGLLPELLSGLFKIYNNEMDGN